MKLVTAVIQPSQLDRVREALIAAGITRITVSRVSGHGRQQGEQFYRGHKIVPSLLSKVQLSMAVSDEAADVAVETILDSACTNGGTVGDGKIFVSQLDECIRIRTGERSGEAI